MTTQEKILADAKQRRTRKAEINGIEINVRVYSSNQLQKIINEITGSDDEKAADIIAQQFVDDDDNQIYTSDFLLSDDCSQVYIKEIASIFIEVNAGIYKKKV